MSFFRLLCVLVCSDPAGRCAAKAQAEIRASLGARCHRSDRRLAGRSLRVFADTGRLPASRRATGNLIAAGVHRYLSSLTLGRGMTGAPAEIKRKKQITKSCSKCSVHV